MLLQGMFVLLQGMFVLLQGTFVLLQGMFVLLQGTSVLLHVHINPYSILIITVRVFDNSVKTNKEAILQKAMVGQLSMVAA